MAWLARYAYPKDKVQVSAFSGRHLAAIGHAFAKPYSLTAVVTAIVARAAVVAARQGCTSKRDRKSQNKIP
ncbi:hypothetical protein TSUD_279280 [Trifolium subterraneum]|uniref:Uncharacterized protein n=1 Tax=Trifolium subterraneum TaxID=3900 RepID=A0A2Z6NSC8_TRISU|nr:hypothetical protein TSUD_279280 [Trifolium subterraneum]